jgi:histidyl-tRNA synthetase
LRCYHRADPKRRREARPMADKSDKGNKSNKLKARLPRGLGDRGPAEIAATRRMIEQIRAVYERYGFEPAETPAIEYTDALGKFLPDQDRPNEGVFSFQDDDEQWLSLRYDLTAPLARYVAENFDALPKPYRSYRYGYVFRNEKPGPGRFRQFMQFDADTVGSASMAADAEICMLAADTMEALGVPRGAYLVKVSNRKVLDGVMEAVGLGGDENLGRRLTVLRAIDKFDRLGIDGVRDLLGEGRKDASGDFTRGAGLGEEQIAPLLRLLNFNKIYDAIQRGEFHDVDTQFPNPFLVPPITWDADAFVGRTELMLEKAASLKPVNPTRKKFDYSFGIDLLGKAALIFEMNETLATGLNELAEIEYLFQAAGYVDTLKRSDPIEFLIQESKLPRALIDLTVVRGLEYYTGPVYEVELFAHDDNERPIRFGSVAGGGRYDGLVARFRSESVPATGFSIGVSRLLAALQHLGKIETKAEPGPVVVTVFDQNRIADYQRMVQALRNAEYAPGRKIRAELYLGSGKMGPQLKYADKRNAPCVVIQGGDEKAKGEVQVKDLALGAELAGLSKDHEDYRAKQAEAQFAVPEDKLVDAVRAVLARHKVNWE